MVLTGSLLSACETVGLDAVGVGLDNDSLELVVYFQPCREAATVHTVSVFLPRAAVLGCTKQTIVEQPVWEVTASKASVEHQFVVGHARPPFSATVSLAGAIPSARLWAYVSSSDPGDSHVWQHVQAFQVAALQPGQVLADGRLMSPETFFQRDTCNPPKEQKLPFESVSPARWAEIGGGMTAVVGTLAFLDARGRRRRKKSGSSVGPSNHVAR